MDGHTDQSDKIKNFALLLLTSLVVAALAFAIPLLIGPGSRDEGIKVSALLACLWGVLILFAFAKFRRRALWFLLGTPFIGFWFFVLFLIAWGCAHNLKACP